MELVRGSRIRFRPLTGIVVLIDDTYVDFNNNLHVSVPLRGLWFLSSKERESTLKEIRFRPLTGIVVLIYHTAEKM